MLRLLLELGMPLVHVLQTTARLSASRIPCLTCPGTNRELWKLPSWTRCIILLEGNHRGAGGENSKRLKVQSLAIPESHPFPNLMESNGKCCGLKTTQAHGNSSNLQTSLLLNKSKHHTTWSNSQHDCYEHSGPQCHPWSGLSVITC